MSLFITWLMTQSRTRCHTSSQKSHDSFIRQQAASFGFGFQSLSIKLHDGKLGGVHRKGKIGIATASASEVLFEGSRELRPCGMLTVHQAATGPTHVWTLGSHATPIRPTLGRNDAPKDQPDTPIRARTRENLPH